MENENLTPAAPEEPAVQPAAEPTEAAAPAPQPEQEVLVKAPAAIVTETPEGAALRMRRLRRKQGVHRVLRFTSIVLGVTAALLFLLCCLMTPLSTLLEQYEQSRPEKTAEAVYDMLFADPDWELLYELSGAKDTTYEGKPQYAAYMTDKVGTSKLTYTEVPAGMSGLHRYSVRLNGEEVAVFSTVSVEDGESTFPYWTLDSVEVFFSGDLTVTVISLPDQTVYVNGEPLNDSHTVLSVSTLAENYLPDGVHGTRYIQQQVTGLLTEPDISIVDANGEAVTVTYDSGVYSVELPTSPAITDEEYAAAVAAAQAEAQFAIRAISISTLRQHFDPSGSAYELIRSGDALVSSFESYEFDESATAVTEFYHYNDDLFSATVTVKLDVTNSRGKVTSYEFCASYFFSRNNAGTYMATERLEVSPQQHVTAARLSFVYEGLLLGSQFVSPGDSIINPAMDDSILCWADAEGNIILVLQEDGSFTPAEGVTLAPMAVYPVTEEAAE